MDPQSADALLEAFAEFDADASAHVAVLWGEGGAFCAGWDLKYASSLDSIDARCPNWSFPSMRQLAFHAGRSGRRGSIFPSR